MRVAIIADAHGNYRALEAALNAIETEHVDMVVAAGDMINPFPGSSRVWQKKEIALCGSCGFQMTGESDLAYLIAEQRLHGWNLRDVHIPYDRNGHISEMLESDYLQQCGPIGWLYFADFVFLEDHLMDYFRHEHKTYHPATYDGLMAAAKAHFIRTGRLAEMISYIGTDL